MPQVPSTVLNRDYYYSEDVLMSGTLRVAVRLNVNMLATCLARKVLNKCQWNLWWWRCHLLAQNFHRLSFVRTINLLVWHLWLSANWFLYLSKLLCDDALHNPSVSASCNGSPKHTKCVTLPQPLILFFLSSYHVQILQGPAWYSVFMELSLASPDL